jgi:hypothetical protein
MGFCVVGEINRLNDVDVFVMIEIKPIWKVIKQNNFKNNNLMILGS